MKSNNQTPTLIQLYTTSACHLCELAEALLEENNLIAEMIEIANEDTLVLRYGERIPVLKRSDTQAELGWPFTSKDILIFMQ